MDSIVFFQDIYFRQPYWILLALQPFVILLLKLFIHKSNLLLYADVKLHAWLVVPARHSLNRFTILKNTAFLFAWLLVAIALAGPRIPIKQLNNELLMGVNIMLVVDLSRSMTAIDVTPSRLLRAKIEIFEFIDKTQQRHRIGVVVYSARPHLLVPLTFDHIALKYYLDTIEKIKFPTLGSDPISAILFAQNELIKVPKKSVVLLITDGDFPEITKTQLQRLKENNIPLYVLGIGTVEGEAILLQDGSWLTHNQNSVISKMNEENLRYMARNLNGKYSKVYDDDSDWSSIYAQGISRIDEKISINKNGNVMWLELFPYFLVPSLFLFWLSLNLYQIKITSHFFIMIVIIFTAPTKKSFAYELGKTAEQSAYQYYIHGKYEKSRQRYQFILGYNGYIGQGNSLYRIGDFTNAIKPFSLAVLNAENDKQRVIALYNLANSYFRTGNFDSAIKTYQDVLRYQPYHQASIYNLNISIILKKNIARRIQQQQKINTAFRQGSGPRSITINEGTDISLNTSVSIAASNKNSNMNIPIPKLPDTSADVVNKLIIAGLNRVKLAVAEHQNDQGLSIESNLNINLLKANDELLKTSDTQHLLWKSLFEIEEGFPAPVDNAKIVPGIKPW